jgi:ATP-dependent Lon protease
MSNDLIYPIAEFKAVKKRVDDLAHRSEDVKSRMAGTLKGFWNTERVLRAVTSNTDFNELRENFPQFEEVIDFYENTIISLGRLNLPFEIPPVLLQGDPGLGKTYFASELAKLIQLPFFEISLATSTASFTLSGGSIQWAEGEPGFISKALSESKVANPIILIDEIDKSMHGSKFNSLNVFYGLLESHSAKRFRDEALDFNLDASKIIWIATANYINNIPAPIQSRMRVFSIRQPNKACMQPVVKSIYSHLVNNKAYGKLLDESLNADVIENLAMQSPRTIKIALEECAFKAIRNQRSAIHSSDLPIFNKEKNRVGFY